MKFVYEKTGIEVQIGNVVVIDGKTLVVDHIQKPHKPRSTGRVYVVPDGVDSIYSRQFFPKPNRSLDQGILEKVRA